MDKKINLPEVCEQCGHTLVLQDIYQICKGCGNAKNSSNIYKVEQNKQLFQRKKATGHNKSKKEPKQTIQEHLQQNWVEYIKGFKTYIQQIGKELHLNIRPLFNKYLNLYTNKKFISNWTIAPRGHQKINENGIVESKYKKIYLTQCEDQIEYKQKPIENFEDQIINQFDNNNTDIRIQNEIIVKKQKLCFVQRIRRTKRNLMNQKEPFGSLITVQNLEDYLIQVYSKIQLTDTIYQVIIHAYFDKFYIPSEDAIKPINNHKRQYIIKELLHDKEIDQLPLSSKIEYIFLNDLMVVLLESRDSLYNQLKKWKQHNDSESSKIEIQNKIFFMDKIADLLKCTEKQKNLANDSKKTQEQDLLPLDFTAGLILIYSTNIITTNKFSPSKLIQLIKQRKISFLDGFSKYMKLETTHQYLTIPRHLPKPAYIKHQSLKLLKILEITIDPAKKEQVFNYLIDFFQEINVSKQLINIALSFDEQYFSEYKIQKYNQDIYACSLLMIATKYYLTLDQEEAQKQITQIVNTCKHIQPFDYSDLNNCDQTDIMKSLQINKNLEAYYGDEEINGKLQQKLKEVEDFFNSQILEDKRQPSQQKIQTQQIKPQFTLKKVKYESYESMEDFDNEWPQIRFLAAHLSKYLDETEELIQKEFQKMENCLS